MEPSQAIIVAHRGEVDVSRLEALERRVAALEGLEATVERLCRIAAREHDIAADRLRELELAS